MELDLGEKNKLRKNDERKELVSWLLNRKTAVTQEWIAQQLGMGSRVNVSRAIQRIERSNDALMKQKKAGLEEMYICVH
ncbi:MAG: HTH domain-containing protein [Chloroflexi bacterium]|nr:HTH domain-containing protein [Chloroflexota bacterium]